MTQTFIAQIRFIPEHFNPRCQAIIPARWAGDVELDCGLTYGSSSVQADEPTREDCIAALLAGLKQRGLTGRLRVVA